MRQGPENRRAVQQHKDRQAIQQGLHDLEDIKAHNFSERPESEISESESMDEIGTVAFLKLNGFRQVNEHAFEPGKPLLYVYPGYLQKRLTKDGKWPCLARINNPTDLTYEPHLDENSQESGWWLKSEGDVTVYDINRKTKAIKPIISGVKNRPYFVRLPYLFYADDEFFPKPPETS